MRRALTGTGRRRVAPGHKEGARSMAHPTRREFLALGLRLAGALGLASTAVPGMAEALETLSKKGIPLLWLQGLGCAGCTVSLLDSDPPAALDVLTDSISLLFHPTLSASTGAAAVKRVRSVIERGGFTLVVEGSIPEGMPEACMLGGEPVSEWVLRAARKADAVAAAGTCASFGGIPAAEGNSVGAVSVPDFLRAAGVSTPLVRVPGCPPHPDWLLGSLVYLNRFGVPGLDEKDRPRAYYARLVHDRCPRFADYERERYAKHFGDEGCLFELGCQGPTTRADCGVRPWNSGVNTCIRAGAPCIGCAAEDFASRKGFPFFIKHGRG